MLNKYRADDTLARYAPLTALVDRPAVADPPPVNWRGKMKVIRRYGLPATVILLLYWRVAWDVLLCGTVPMPQLKLPRLGG